MVDGPFRPSRRAPRSCGRRVSSSSRRGYAATSLKGIAAQAGVSVQTVYDSVGSKADLVRRLSDLIDEEAQVGEIARELPAETDPVAVVGDLGDDHLPDRRALR